jgi:hypothetical protein
MFDTFLKKPPKYRQYVNVKLSLDDYSTKFYKRLTLHLDIGANLLVNLPAKVFVQFITQPYRHARENQQDSSEDDLPRSYCVFQILKVFRENHYVLFNILCDLSIHMFYPHVTLEDLDDRKQRQERVYRGDDYNFDRVLNEPR